MRVNMMPKTGCVFALRRCCSCTHNGLPRALATIPTWKLPFCMSEPAQVMAWALIALTK